MKTLEKILDILYPPICINCKKGIDSQKNILCKKCFNKIQINTAFMCPRCGGRKTTLNNTCHKTPFILAPATFYHEPISALIHYYKYNNLLEIRKILAAILIVYLNNLNINVSKFIISYIPLHKKKERERGFNQSYELARIISNYFNIPLYKTIAKAKYNKPQAKMKSHKERAENVKNAFEITNRKNVVGKNIILVDDVSTSGATLYEISKLLKKNEAKKIIGLVVAKAD